MIKEEKNKLEIQNFGDHHQAQLLIDADSQSITGGAILNFSDHSAVSLSIDNESKASAKFGHSGDTHSFNAFTSSNGDFEGSFKDSQAGIALKLSSNIAEISEGQIPEMGLEVKGDHHKTVLNVGPEGKITGTLESLNTSSASFKLKIEDGKIESGSFAHKGTHHRTQITINKTEWAAEIITAKDDLNWSIGVEKGDAELKALGKINIKF